MASPPRIIALDRIDPQLRDHLVGVLQRPIARVPAGSGKGVLFGTLLLVVGGVVAMMHHSNLTGGSPPGNFYSPWWFAIATAVAWVSVAMIAGDVMAQRRLRAAPFQGKYVVGANIVIADERRLVVYSFATLEKCEVRSAQYGSTLYLHCGGLHFLFRMPSDQAAIHAEQQVQGNHAAMQRAIASNDQATIQALDPFASVPPHELRPVKRRRSAWLVALPAIAVTIPLAYLIDRMADESSFDGLRMDDSYRVDRYLGRGGRHDAELRRRQCEHELGAVKEIYQLEMVAQKCPAGAAAAKARIDGIYKDARARLMGLPPAASAVMTKIFEASRNGPVAAEVTVTGPQPEQLAEIDTALAETSGKIAPLAKTFNAANLAGREQAMREKMVQAINELAPLGVLRVTADGDVGPAVLRITIAYALIPMIKDDRLVVYELASDDDRPASRRSISIWDAYLGLTIRVAMTMKIGDAAYDVSFDAPADHNFAVSAGESGILGATAVYETMVDTALDAVSRNLSVHVFGI